MGAFPRGFRLAFIARFAFIARLPIVCTTVCVMTFPTPVVACPNCIVGREARAQVWNDAFTSHLLVTLLPFLLIGAICLCVESLGRPPNRKAKSPRSAMRFDASRQQSALHTGEP